MVRARIGGLRLFSPLVGDLVLAIGLAVAGEAQLWASGDLSWEAATAVLVLSLPLAARRRAPLVALGGFMAGLGVLVASGHSSGDLSAAAPIAGLVALYSVGAYAQGWASVAGACGVLAVVWIAVGADRDGRSFGNFLFFGIGVGGPWAAGVALRRRRTSERTLQARAERLERDRDETARRAVTEERQRVARELHDVVAHSISVIILQARGGRRVLDDAPEQAREAFDSIEATGREALTEMRRLLGLLRRTDEELALTPRASMRRLGALVDQVRQAGLPVDLEIEGDPAQLPAGVDLSGYRIIQEALTNTLRHAGPAQARVVVHCADQYVEINVSDDGSGPNGASPGHGLAGIRERVSLYGGELRTGPRPGGGYEVFARLPRNTP
jgi:signal transduction histidine kinase